jgi:hypothetical protein
MLSMLYKDERITNTEAIPQFPFMEKMLMERLIPPCARNTQMHQQIFSVVCGTFYGRGATLLSCICSTCREVSSLRHSHTFLIMCTRT